MQDTQTIKAHKQLRQNLPFMTKNLTAEATDTDLKDMTDVKIPMFKRMNYNRKL
jgi:hypothetical protein